MRLMKKGNERIIGAVLGLVLVLTTVFAFPINTQASNGDSGSVDLNVDYHTKAEIAKYIREHPYENAKVTTFDVEPSIKQPYSLGKVSDATLNDGCTLINIYRYIAGIPYDVTIDAGYVEYAQAAAVVNAANGQMSHFPSKPSGMSDEMYEKGKKGASSSNIGWNYGNLASVISNGWMKDSDTSNRVMVGHRRWVLNPKMGKTGFGLSPNGIHSAMYAFDSSNAAGADYSCVAWPAQNTPIGYFSASYPWTLSIGESVSDATVKITCENDGREWSFSGSSSCNSVQASGYFNINNGGYGQTGCIIFVPNGITVSKDYSYDVSVKYTTYYGTDSIDYTVDFFDLDDYATYYTEEQEAQVKAFVERFYNLILERPSDEKGVNDWTQALLKKQITGAQAAEGFVNGNEFQSRTLTDEEFLNIFYLAFFDRNPDAEGYAVWKGMLDDGASRAKVLVGFTNSLEFQDLCKRFGIDPGSLPEVIDPEKPKPDPKQPGKWDASNVDDAKLREYVERLYIKSLGRPGEEDGINAWIKVIKDGKDDWGTEYDAAKVASVGFFTSQEYKNKNKTNEEFLIDLYAAFFDRDPDAEGFNLWLDKMNNEGYSRERVIEECFGCSTEFEDLLKSYGFTKNE